MDTYDDSVWRRFWSKVQKTETCWLWTAAQVNGYGALRVARQTLTAHRLSYIYHFGPIPDGLYVLHHCDVRICVRADHLFLGTHLDNIQDMVRKKRHWMATVDPASLPRGDAHWSRRYPERIARGERHSSRTHPERIARGEQHGSRTHPESRLRGIQHPRAKLTDTQVQAIRHRAKLMQNKRGTRVQLAREFGVCPEHISAILLGKARADVPD
jgi:hypothetical protein